MLVGVFAFTVSAEDEMSVFVDGKSTKKVDVNFYSDELYVCIEQLFSYLGYDVSSYSNSSVGVNQVTIKNDEGDELVEFGYYDYSVLDDISKTEVTYRGIDEFNVESESSFSADFYHTYPMVTIDEDHHYLHHSELAKVLKLRYVIAKDINAIALYVKKSIPDDIDIYNRYGQIVKICPAFKTLYTNAGYNTKLEKVLVLPEPKVVSVDGIKVSLNGALLQFDVPPAIISSRTMVPLRVIFEALNATVEWQAETRTVVSTKGDTTIKLTVDSAEMTINDSVIALDCPATVVGGRTLVPVRAVSEAFGVNVEWDANLSLVKLREAAYAKEETVILYNKTKQIVEVPAFAVAAYKNEGWMASAPVTMYAADGTSDGFPPEEVEAKKAEGWYTYPVTTMYAPDGRSIVVANEKVEANKKVGWYTYPVTTMYAADGRSQVVPTSNVEANKKVGWYTESQYVAVKNSYLAGNDFRSIRYDYPHAVANGAYIYPFVNSDGDTCVLIYISYKIQTNWSETVLHNITKGTKIKNPADYYDKQADRAYGANKLYYMNLKGDMLKAELKAMEGYVGKSNEGYYVSAATLNK
nr:copper amine oxidase N-terminal domain-containing protein [Clostridia bacterium]